MIKYGDNTQGIIEKIACFSSIYLFTNKKIVNVRNMADRAEGSLAENSFIPNIL